MNEDAGPEVDSASEDPTVGAASKEPFQAPSQPAAPVTQHRGDRPQGRGKRGGGTRGKSLYTFADGLERCFCRNATHPLPETFPVAGRARVATPKLVELARTDQMILFCDLLHEGPHMWPDGEQFTPD